MKILTFLWANLGLILSLLATIASVVCWLISVKKNGNKKGLIALVEQIPTLVMTAESLFGSGKGTAKLDYVLTQLRLYALQNSIKVNVDDLTAQVNSIVNCTNNVNMNKTINLESTPNENVEQDSLVEDKPTTTENLNII